MLDFNLGFLNKMTGVRTKDQSAADALLAIADQNGDIIYNDSPFSKDELFSVQNGSARLSADGMQYQIDFSKSDANDWILYSIINETALYRNINRNLVWQVTLILISMLLIFAVILLVSRTLSGQFRHFIETVSHTTAPDEHALITVDSEDEFRDLAQVYNDMILRINHLIETVYTKELLLKNAELKAFQAQINPHFLYNTLDCINGLVDLDRPNDIKKTITALASIMRMSIKGKEIMTVRENIRYINEYMFIEQLRYPDNLIFLNEIPEEMMEFYIPKLILQPILENSVIHGTSSLLGKGMIALLGKEEPDALIFTVSDNGVGFPEAILQLFRESPENHLDDTQTQSRLGLLNIQKRIHLMYGTEYGLTLQNLPAGGSRVTIRLPKITTP
ncbi:sensor histidine kinase [Hominenteromicrobium sp.]